MAAGNALGEHSRMRRTRCERASARWRGQGLVTGAHRMLARPCAPPRHKRMPSDAFVDAIVDDRFERTSAVAPLVDMTERFGLMLGVTTAPSHKMTHLRSYFTQES